jgi:para-aminobenzoate synthetase component 1
LFAGLNSVAPAPFTTFFKYHDKYLLCASPERFLAKQNHILIAQPIKGTRKRRADVFTDSQIAEALANSEKDRAENIMIVDLLRNDLSRVCVPGSVVVSELCKVYSFSHVHQMISTVIGEIKPEIEFADVLKATFPMGSMTGAPKIQVMKDIERFENFSRGWYSGCLGYWENGDFDLNVVIRALQADTKSENMYYHVGGAITYDSVPEEEYQECLQKAAGLLQALKNQESSNL